MIIINNQKEILLSVIVPIYNAELYLKDCIKSVINQQYRNLEIILINDGSTDESGKICDEFAIIEGRIRVIHQNNQGSVKARQVGVEAAKAKVITFVDADDWIESDMYSNIMKEYMKFSPDMIASGMIIDNKGTYYEKVGIAAGLYDKQGIKEEIIPKMMYDKSIKERAITPSICNKLFKADLLKEVIMDIDESITYGDDAAISYIYIARSSKILVLENCWYHYRIHCLSMMRSLNIDSFKKTYKFFVYMKKKFLDLCIWNEMESQLKQYTKSFIKSSVRDVFGIHIEEPIYLFPFELVGKGSKIAIYGAGKVGKSYIKEIEKSGYAKICAWVDENYKKIDLKNYLIESPDRLTSKDIEYVVIAIENKEIALKIKELMLSKGICKKKIIWKIPFRLN